MASPKFGLIQINVSDIVGAKASMPKLIETVAAGFGFVGNEVSKLLEPVNIRRMADARQYEAISEARKKLIVDSVESGSPVERASAIATLRDLQRLENHQRIIEYAANELPEEVSPDAVDVDWTAEFFDSCQNVQDDDVRRFWGKVLAGEIAEPGSFSKQTLNILRLLSRDEARAFEALCSCQWVINGEQIPIVLKEHLNHPRAIGIERSDIIALASHGLIQTNVFLGYVLDTPARLFQADYHGRKLTLTIDNEQPDDVKLGVGAVEFTRAGSQLSSAVVKQPNDEYFADVRDHFEGRSGFTLVEECGPSPHSPTPESNSESGRTFENRPPLFPRK